MAKSIGAGLERITPARAGKSGGGADIEDDDRDHPRACGEELVGGVRPDHGDGSPPRVRGRGSCGTLSGCARRITPARAGKREELMKDENGVQDHPRACGEEGVPVDGLGGSEGSPPRVRGRVYTTSSPAKCQRITPARAGKRQS